MGYFCQLAEPLLMLCKGRGSLRAEIAPPPHQNPILALNDPRPLQSIRSGSANWQNVTGRKGIWQSDIYPKKMLLTKTKIFVH